MERNAGTSARERSRHATPEPSDELDGLLARELDHEPSGVGPTTSSALPESSPPKRLSAIAHVLRQGNRTFAGYLSYQSKVFLMIFGCFILACLGGLDLVTGSELDFAIFYLVPVSITVWFVGTAGGLVMALASAWVWLLAYLLERELIQASPVDYCNAAANLGVFLVVALSLSALRRALACARTDYLTGINNGRNFCDLLAAELSRARRFRLVSTIGYLDVDGFKGINDRFGHRIGNVVLQTVADTVRQQVRQHDVVARLGGDEFGLFFPETDATEAQVVLNRIQTGLLSAMREHDWPVTFSIGAVTFLSPPDRVETFINLADRVMYAAKLAGKNQVKYYEVRPVLDSA
jgi:diguanylate cyclase (GGDEF)-like protein